MTSKVLAGALTFAALALTAGCGAKTACGPTTCKGCCSTDGVCQTGNDQAQCGASGTACVGCSSGQTCTLGGCEFGGNGGGVGGGSGGGGGGGVDAGFTPSAHRPFPAFPAGTGHVLSPMTLVTIVAANDPLAPSLAQFSDELIASNWYSEVGADYGVGPAAASVQLTGPAITQDLTDSQVEGYIIDAVASGPAVNGQTFYLVYLPGPYIVSTSPFCGYHRPYPDAGTTLGDGWGVVTACAPFVGGETQLQAETRVGSHEIIEAITDSFRGYRFGLTPPTPWTTSVWKSYEESGSVEVGDLCEGTRILQPGRDGGLWEYQRSWSNTTAAAGEDPCVPANPGGYFNVSVPQDWYDVDAGAALLIPLTGWSTVARGNWLVRTVLKNGTNDLLAIGADAGFWATTTGIGALTLGPGCAARQGMNDGVAGTLQVNMPASAVSGDFAVLEIHSFEEDPANCYPYTDRDDYHFWLVGVHVP